MDAGEWLLEGYAVAVLYPNVHWLHIVPTNKNCHTTLTKIFILLTLSYLDWYTHDRDRDRDPVHQLPTRPSQIPPHPQIRPWRGGGRTHYLETNVTSPLSSLRSSLSDGSAEGADAGPEAGEIVPDRLPPVQQSRPSLLAQDAKGCCRNRCAPISQPPPSLAAVDVARSARSPGKPGGGVGGRAGGIARHPNRRGRQRRRKAGGGERGGARHACSVFRFEFDTHVPSGLASR